MPGPGADLDYHGFAFCINQTRNFRVPLARMYRILLLYHSVYNMDSTYVTELFVELPPAWLRFIALRIICLLKQTQTYANNTFRRAPRKAKR